MSGTGVREAVGEVDESRLLDLAGWRREWRPDRWRKALQEPEDDRILALIRRSTHTGRPLATDGVLCKLEHKLGRRLRALPVGRPKKADTKRTRVRTRGKDGE